MKVEWKTLEQKKPEEDARFYAVTIYGGFRNVITSAYFRNNHFWRKNKIIDSEVIRWADGLDPYDGKEGE